MTAPSTTSSMDRALYHALSETTDWFRRMGGGNCYPSFDDDHIPTFVGLLLAVASHEVRAGRPPIDLDFGSFRERLDEQGREDHTPDRICRAMRLDTDRVFPQELFDRVAPVVFKAVSEQPGRVPEALDYLQGTVARLLHRHPRKAWSHLMQTQLWSNAAAPDAAGGAA